MSDSENVFTAVASGNIDQLKQLLDGDGALASARDGNGVSVIMTAAYHRKPEMVELLRQHIPELDVFEAVTLGDEDRVRELLDVSETVSARSPDGFELLHLAAFFDRPQIVELLLKAGAPVEAVAGNPSQVRPLHSAAASGSHDVVRLLLNAGANPNSVQHGGWTALHSAAKQGDMELVAMLVEHGADPHQKADTDETAITMAADDKIRAFLSTY